MFDFTFRFGEMLLYERMLLYDYVRQYKPNMILECGSGLGASTWIMINALKSSSKIYSCDPIRKPKRTSTNLYFYPIKSEDLIVWVLKKKLYPDFIFFDGPEDPNVALQDFMELDKCVGIGTIFSMHDWCGQKRKYDGAVSIKARLLKPYINALPTWELLEETDGLNYKEGKESVGLCFYKKISM